MNSAYACSCKKSTVTQKYEKSSKVFIAHITSTEEIVNDKSNENDFNKRYIKATYNVKEVFKGSPINGGSVTDRVYRGANCSVGIMAGLDYVIFQYSSNEISVCNGTTYYGSEHSEKVVRTLKMLRHYEQKKHNK